MTWLFCYDTLQQKWESKYEKTVSLGESESTLDFFIE